MSGGPPCQFCDGAKGSTVLMTWLTNGASVQVCDDDLAPALINILAVDLGVDPTKFYDRVRTFVDQQAKAQAKAAEKGTPPDTASEQDGGPGESTPVDHDDPDERADVVRIEQEVAAAAGDDQ